MAESGGYTELRQDIRTLGIEVRAGFDRLSGDHTGVVQRVSTIEEKVDEREKTCSSRGRGTQVIVERVNGHDRALSQLRGALIAINAIMAVAIFATRMHWI